MKKILPILIVGILVISGLGAAALPDSEPEILVKADSISFSKPVFEENGEYLSVDFEEVTSKLMKTGKPIIPVVSKVFSFPVGTKIGNVDVKFDIEQYILSKKIQPSPKPVPMSMDLITDSFVFDVETYASSDLYPSKPYSVQMGVGLKDGEHVLYLTVRCYAQYSPAMNVINIPENIDMQIKYV